MAPTNGKFRFNFSDGYKHPICRRSDVLSTSNKGKRTKVSKTITIKSGTVFDGKGGTWYGDKGKMGDGDQDEGQKPIFALEPGATLRNVIIDKSAADGVYCRGKGCLVEHVTWLDVGEDALSSKGPPDCSDSDGGLWGPEKNGSCKPNNKVQAAIYKCKFYKAQDKVIQSSNRCDWVIMDCYFKDCDNCFLTNFQDNIWLINCEYVECEVLIQVNTLSYDAGSAFNGGPDRHVDLWYYNIKGYKIEKEKYKDKSYGRDWFKKINDDEHLRVYELSGIPGFILCNGTNPPISYRRQYKTPGKWTDHINKYGFDYKLGTPVQGGTGEITGGGEEWKPEYNEGYGPGCSGYHALKKGKGQTTCAQRGLQEKQSSTCNYDSKYNCTFTECCVENNNIPDNKMDCIQDKKKKFGYKLQKINGLTQTQCKNACDDNSNCIYADRYKPNGNCYLRGMKNKPGWKTGMAGCVPDAPVPTPPGTPPDSPPNSTVNNGHGPGCAGYFKSKIASGGKTCADRGLKNGPATTTCQLDSNNNCSYKECCVEDSTKPPPPSGGNGGGADYKPAPDGNVIYKQYSVPSDFKLLGKLDLSGVVGRKDKDKKMDEALNVDYWQFESDDDPSSDFREIVKADSLEDIPAIKMKFGGGDHRQEQTPRDEALGREGETRIIQYWIKIPKGYDSKRNNPYNMIWQQKIYPKNFHPQFKLNLHDRKLEAFLYRKSWGDSSGCSTDCGESSDKSASDNKQLSEVADQSDIEGKWLLLYVEIYYDNKGKGYYKVKMKGEDGKEYVNWKSKDAYTIHPKEWNEKKGSGSDKEGKGQMRFGLYRTDRYSDYSGGEWYNTEPAIWVKNMNDITKDKISKRALRNITQRAVNCVTNGKKWGYTLEKKKALTLAQCATACKNNLESTHFDWYEPNGNCYLRKVKDKSNWEHILKNCQRSALDFKNTSNWKWFILVALILIFSMIIYYNIN